MGTTDIAKGERLERYIPYRESLMIAKNHQPWENPEKPIPIFSKKLRLAVLAAMPKLPQEFHKNLKFYTSVGSPLDQYHGVDAFFEFEIAGREPICITLDITMKPGKDAWRSDILFSVENVDVETFTQDISIGKFDNLIERVAAAVARGIIKNITRQPFDRVFIPEERSDTTL